MWETSKHAVQGHMPSKRPPERLMERTLPALLLLFPSRASCSGYRSVFNSQIQFYPPGDTNRDILYLEIRFLLSQLGEATGISWSEAKNNFKHTTMHRTVSHNKKYSGRNIINSTGTKPVPDNGKAERKWRGTQGVSNKTANRKKTDVEDISQKRNTNGEQNTKKLEPR